jgi:hypothetical protein
MRGEVAAGDRVVITLLVVMQPGFLVVILAGEPQRGGRAAWVPQRATPQRVLLVPGHGPVRAYQPPGAAVRGGDRNEPVVGVPSVGPGGGRARDPGPLPPDDPALPVVPVPDGPGADDQRAAVRRVKRPS